MPDILFLDQVTADTAALAGGKGQSLGLMIQAGLPVPPGFCLSSEVHRRTNGEWPQDIAQSIVDAYRRLGGGLVAVRSSATAEDGASTSFAGQQETFLGVQGDEAVLDAIRKCWLSLDSERARAYRAKQGVDKIDMAVVVQRLIPAEIAGVLFTHDPNDPAGPRMFVDASWGLGESVVSGRVTPDHFVLDRETGRILDKKLGDKKVQRATEGEVPVDAEWQNVFCMTERQLAQLAELGRRVVKFFGDPRDIEWAWADGRVWLLQARPITTGGLAERAQIIREEITELRSRSAASGTIWGRFNLSEVLPEPTTMTWSIVRRFMSGKGGYGRMFADLGFVPDPALDDECTYDLICGRPYMNLSREPRMQWGDLPFGHDMAAIRKDPNRAAYSTANFLTASASIGQKFRSVWRIVRGGWSFQNQSRTFADKFRRVIIPQFLAEVTAAEKEDWSKLQPLDILTILNQWIERSLITFARDSLKPTAFAASAMATIQKQLEKPLGTARSQQVIGELTQGVHPDAGADFPTALQEYARGVLSQNSFLEQHGHRGRMEMELAQPRWREDEAGLAKAVSGVPIMPAKPVVESTSALDRITAEAKLNPTQRALLRQEVDRLRTAVALRETGKHHLLRGYALIRKALLEIDRRTGLAGGVFYLMHDELPALLSGTDMSSKIAQRRKRRSIALGVEVPPVVFSDDLDAIGRALPAPSGAHVLQGAALSAGSAEGPALVLTDPHGDVPNLDSFILVCPSTDPSWVPLFARAKGLVMETGGVLSHGAIVAREFALPAVAGIPGIVRQLQTGQIIRVDGTGGTVTIC